MRVIFSSYSSSARTIAAVAVMFMVSACATPSKIERVDCHCKLGNADLGELMEKALEDPLSHESAHALAYFVEQWHEDQDGEMEGLVEAPSTDKQDHPYKVTFDSPGIQNPFEYFKQISPAYDFKVKKIKHHHREGIGAPLLAIRDNDEEEPIESFYPPEAIVRPLTAVISAETKSGDAHKVQISLLSPYTRSEIKYNGKKELIAADMSVPWAALLSKAGNLKKSEVRDFITSTPIRQPHLFLMEPYSPDKEPLIMIHGLLGSPLIWAELTNTLWADDAIRDRYQIWHFLYNTSAPALYSGRMLRYQLRDVRALLDPDGNDPAMQSTTIIAHSMGGIITRSLLTKPENAYWDAAFTQPFDSLKLSEEDRESLKEAFFWDSTPHVKRVIYIAASHRGSEVADKLLGRFGGLVASPPKDGFRDFYERITSANPGSFTKAYKELGEGKHNSIHALSPRHPTLIILSKLPNNHAVREFSIIGNEGKTGPLEKSSDGVVPYWSSHIDRAEAEKIVPAGHFAFKHPETVKEVKRVLKLP